MGVYLKDNEVKDNVTVIGLVNNVAQVKTEVSTTLTNENKLEIKATLGGCIQAFIENKATKFIGKTKYDTALFLSDLNKKIGAIPTENVTEPRTSILGPTLETLKYNIDEEQIREMFINLLVSETDNRKQNKVLPAYIEIVRQLSSDDAALLKQLKKIGKKQLSLCFIKLQPNNKNGYKDLDTIIVNNINNTCRQIIQPQKIILENLERLKIIQLERDLFLINDKDSNEDAFNYYSKNIKNDVENTSLSYDNGVLTITDFGMQFIDICCS